MRIKRLLGPKESVAAPQVVALTLLGIVIAASGVCITIAAHAQNNPTQLQRPQRSALGATLATEDSLRPEPLVNRR